MSFIISDAVAAPATAAPGAEGLLGMVPMLLIFICIFYFMIFRPQSKRAKEHKALMGSLTKGDEVLTSGGLIGKIVKVSEENEYLKLALSEELTITLKKDYISAVLPKGTLKSL